MVKTLFLIKQRVWLTLSKGTNVNMPYGGFNADFVIYKAVDSKLEFFVRDLDRKPIPSQGKKFKINILGFSTNELVLTKMAKIDDPYRGLISVNLTPAETLLWEPGFYNYAVSVINEDQTENILYVDQDHQAVGYLELRNTNIPRPAKTIELAGNTFMPITDSTPSLTCYLSEVIPGSSQYSMLGNSITMAIYLTNFSGTISVQASLDGTPEQDSTNWFDLDLSPDEDDPSKDYNVCSGIDTFTFEGNYQWLRIKYCPSLSNTGTFDKVLVKV